MFPFLRFESRSRGDRLRRRAIAAAVLPVLVLSACGQSSPGPDSREVVVTVVPGIFDPMLPQLGKHLGIFDKHDLDVSFIEVKDGPSMVSAISSGAADVGEAGPIVSIPAYDRGARLKWLSNNYDIDYSLIAKNDLALPSLGQAYPAAVADLKGMRIGVAGRGGQSELFIVRALKAAGLTADDVTFVAVGTGVSAVAAFKNDQVDAMVSFPPTQYLLDDDSYKTVISVADAQQKVFGDSYIFTAQAANTKFLEERPAVATAYCDGLKDTVTYVEDPSHRDEVVSYLSEKMNLDPDKAGRMWDDYGRNFDTTLTEDRWNALSSYNLGVTTPAWDDAVYKPCTTEG